MSVLRLRSAGARVDLDGVDGGLADLVLCVVGPMLSSDRAPAERRIAVTRDRFGAPVLDGLTLSGELEMAAASLIGAVDRALIAASPCLCVHAAAVAGPRGAAIVPGISGSGKSTLAGAAMQQGLRLVSDEAACLDPHADVLWPHPRPLGLSSHSRVLLGLPEPAAGPTDEERATAPDLLGSCVPTDEAVPVALVVLGCRGEGRAHLREVSQTDGLSALLANCLNTGGEATWTPRSAWLRLAALIPAVRVVRLDYDKPHEGAQLLVDALA